jgi:hypothetical protein
MMKNNPFPCPAGFLWLVCCLATLSFAQAGDVVRERIRLYTDKTLYLAGETVWLKTITTDAAGRPLNLSKLAYVELLDASSPQLQVKLELVDGIGNAYLLLPPTLPTGHYRLVAYTRYMRTEGETVYADRLLPIVSSVLPPRSATAASSARPEASLIEIDLPHIVLPTISDEKNELLPDAADSRTQLFVKLMDGGNTPQSQIKLDLVNGTDEASFSLPSALPSRHYRLVAHISDMQANESVDNDRPLLLPGESAVSPMQPEAVPTLSTDRQVYSTRATGELRIENLPDNVHTLSASITGMDSLTLPTSVSEDSKRGLAGRPLPGEPMHAEYEGHIITGKLVDRATGALAVPDGKPVALLGFVGNRTQLFDGKGEVCFFTQRTAGVREVAATVLHPQYRVDIYNLEKRNVPVWQNETVLKYII